MTDLFRPRRWGNRIEVERWLRIRLLTAAYSYEIATHAPPIMTDAQFDSLALLSDTSITTGQHDEWWRAHFSPHTGRWIHTFPDLTGIAARFNRLNSTQHRENVQC